METSPFRTIVGAATLALAAWGAQAQSRPPTTEQLGKDPGALRQEAERQQSQERARQQESSQQQADQQWNDTLRQQQSRAANDAAQGEAVRRTWQQRPPLAADKNPLLGRWDSLGSGQRKGSAAGLSPEMAQLANALIGSVTAGMCDSMLGRGTIEFRPGGVFAIGRDGHERPMYRADYRGGGSRVVVLPQGGTTFTHMIIDFDNPNHATVAAVGCGLARAGAGSAKAALTSNAPAGAEAPAAVQWTLLGSSLANGGMDVYVAPSSIRRSATGRGCSACSTSRCASRSRARRSSRRATITSTTALGRASACSRRRAFPGRWARARSSIRARTRCRGSRSAPAGWPLSTGKSPASASERLPAQGSALR
jgi:hypothetical protein